MAEKSNLDRIVDCIRRSGPILKSRIAQRTGIKGEIVASNLEHLVADGQVTYSTRGNNHVMYSLAKTATPAEEAQRRIAGPRHIPMRGALAPTHSIHRPTIDAPGMVVRSMYDGALAPLPVDSDGGHCD